MYAYISRASAAGAHGVEALQAAVVSVDSERGDGTFVVITCPVCFIRRVKASSGRIRCQAAWTGAHFEKSGRRHRAGGIVDLEYVNAATIAGRQIHLRRQRIAKRRAEGSDIGHHPSLRHGRLSLAQCEPNKHEASHSGQSPANFETLHFCHSRIRSSLPSVLRKLPILCPKYLIKNEQSDILKAL